MIKEPDPDFAGEVDENAEVEDGVKDPGGNQE